MLQLAGMLSYIIMGNRAEEANTAHHIVHAPLTGRMSGSNVLVEEKTLDVPV